MSPLHHSVSLAVVLGVCLSMWFRNHQPIKPKPKRGDHPPANGFILNSILSSVLCVGLWCLVSLSAGQRDQLQEEPVFFLVIAGGELTLAILEQGWHSSRLTFIWMCLKIVTMICYLFSPKTSVDQSFSALIPTKSQWWSSARSSIPLR